MSKIHHKLEKRQVNGVAPTTFFGMGFIVSEICFLREGHRKGIGSGKKSGCGDVLFVGLLIGWLLVGWLVVVYCLCFIIFSGQILGLYL